MIVFVIFNQKCFALLWNVKQLYCTLTALVIKKVSGNSFWTKVGNSGHSVSFAQLSWSV